MNYTYTEWPVLIDILQYNEAIKRMAQRMMDTGIVHAVYQVGGTNNPGISDIDLYVVFHDNKHYLENPVAGLSGIDKYLFTHRLFGTSVSMATELRNYTFLGNFKLIEGNPVLSNSSATDEVALNELKHQVALEYLIKAWLTISMFLKLKTIKVRSFLLHAKAIRYDLEFLGIDEGNLSSCISEIIHARDNWFSSTPVSSELTRLVHNYEIGLYKTIISSINKYKLYIPPHANLQISKRVAIKNSEHLNVDRKGPHLNSKMINTFSLLKKFYNRLNYFTLNLPFNSDPISGVLSERFETTRKAFVYNSVKLPAFICTGHGMNIFHKES